MRKINISEAARVLVEGTGEWDDMSRRLGAMHAVVKLVSGRLWITTDLPVMGIYRVTRVPMVTRWFAT